MSLQFRSSDVAETFPVASNSPRLRQEIRVLGIVQGVGFRAFVYGLASKLQLAGFVRNDGRDVLIEVEGSAELLAQFGARLVKECPRRARIDDVRTDSMEPAGSAGFVIQPSR